MKRLSEETKAAVLAAYVAGTRTAEIARKYGVSNTYPSNLAARRGLPMRWTVKQRQEFSQRVSWRA